MSGSARASPSALYQASFLTATRTSLTKCSIVVCRTITRSAAARKRRPLQRAVGRLSARGFDATTFELDCWVVRRDEFRTAGLVPCVRFCHDDDDEFHVSAVPEYSPGKPLA